LQLTASLPGIAGAPDAVDESSDDEEPDDETEGSTTKLKNTGFVLEYNAARKIAQGLGAHLEGMRSLVEIKGKIARLLPVAERASSLFGKDEGNIAPAKKKKAPQLDLFKMLQQADGEDSMSMEPVVEQHGTTVLDRIHQSMILFAAGEALKRFLVEEGVGRDVRFFLADCLSASAAATGIRAPGTRDCTPACAQAAHGSRNRFHPWFSVPSRMARRLRRKVVGAAIATYGFWGPP
jgi:hypothetical protein